MLLLLRLLLLLRRQWRRLHYYCYCYCYHYYNSCNVVPTTYDDHCDFRNHLLHKSFKTIATTTENSNAYLDYPYDCKYDYYLQRRNPDDDDDDYDCYDYDCDDDDSDYYDYYYYDDYYDLRNHLIHESFKTITTTSNFHIHNPAISDGHLGQKMHLEHQ